MGQTLQTINKKTGLIAFILIKIFMEFYLKDELQLIASFDLTRTRTLVDFRGEMDIGGGSHPLKNELRNTMQVHLHTPKD